MAAQVNQETLILLLDGIEDPRNVGACLRTAAAAGVDGVIMPAKTGAGLTPAALRVAEGGIHQLNVFELESWTHVLKKLRRRASGSSAHPGTPIPHSMTLTLAAL